MPVSQEHRERVLRFQEEQQAMAEQLTRDEFLSRFKSHLRDLLGEHYDFKYVDHIAPTYWDDEGQRADGPEDCAEAEFSEWGEE